MNYVDKHSEQGQREDNSISDLHKYVSNLDINETYELAVNALKLVRKRHNIEEHAENNRLTLITILFCAQKAIGDEILLNPELFKIN